VIEPLATYRTGAAPRWSANRIEQCRLAMSELEREYMAGDYLKARAAAAFLVGLARQAAEFIEREHPPEPRSADAKGAGE